MTPARHFDLIGPVFLGIWVGLISSGLGDTSNAEIVAGPPILLLLRWQLPSWVVSSRAVALNVAARIISLGSAGLHTDSFAPTYYMGVATHLVHLHAIEGCSVDIARQGNGRE